MIEKWGQKNQYYKLRIFVILTIKCLYQWLIVHTLWNHLILEHLLDLFSTWQKCYRHADDVHMEVWCCKNSFLTNWQGFELSHFPMTAPSIGPFQHFSEMLQTYWRCACGSLMLKKYFWQTDRVLSLAIFRQLYEMFVLWLIVHTCTLWNQLLLELLLDPQQNEVLEGLTVFNMSVIPSFHDTMILSANKDLAL